MVYFDKSAHLQFSYKHTMKYSWQSELAWVPGLQYNMVMKIIKHDALIGLFRGIGGMLPSFCITFFAVMALNEVKFYVKGDKDEKPILCVGRENQTVKDAIDGMGQNAVLSNPICEYIVWGHVKGHPNTEVCKEK